MAEKKVRSEQGDLIIMGKKIFTSWQIIILATIGFVITMVFLDSNNIQVTNELSREIEALTHERDSLLGAISSDSTIIDGIENSDKFLEKYARENFYMRREGEEIFIIEQKKEPEPAAEQEPEQVIMPGQEQELLQGIELEQKINQQEQQ